MTQRIITTLLATMLLAAMWAQDTTTDHINRIKRDKAYLYGEATLKDRDEALKMACELLEGEVEKWAREEAPHLLPLSRHMDTCADTIMTTRSQRVRAFAYVRIADLPGLLAGQALPGDPASCKESPLAPTAAETEVLERLMGVDSFYELEAVMKPLKAEGRIAGYGKYSTMGNPDDCYLIVYDQQARIKAFLGKGTDSRCNLKTGQSDSEANYHGCGAIWLTIRNEDR